MGQKVRPTGLRIGITETWRSRWYARKQDFGTRLVEDQKIRQYVKKNYSFAGIARIDIERSGGQEVKITLHTARPGIIIGRKGAEVERLRETLEKLVVSGAAPDERTKKVVKLDIIEVNKPELSAQLVAEGISEQLSKRASYRRALQKAAEMTMEAGAKGIKILIAGRLGGTEMARRQKLILGSIPLHTFRADIDYGFAEAPTTYGHIGVKVWIYKGLVMPSKETADAADAETGKVQEVATRQG